MQAAAHEHERETGRREEVLHRARREQVDSECADVERDRTGRLVAVRETERPVLVREAGDLGDVEPIARAVRDRRAADERRSLVDRLREALERDSTLRVGAHVDDLRSAQLLRVRDLTDRRELELRDHDAISSRLERERADQAAHSLRDGGDHCHLLRRRADQAREGRPCRIRPFHPVLPLGAVLVPAGEVLVVRLSDVHRERALRAGVGVDRVLEDREAGAYGVPRCQTPAIAQGRPFAAPRAAGARRPFPRARSALSRGRTRDRRSRATRSHSAPRSEARRPRRAPAR